MRVRGEQCRARSAGAIEGPRAWSMDRDALLVWTGVACVRRGCCTEAVHKEDVAHRVTNDAVIHLSVAPSSPRTTDTVSGQCPACPQSPRVRIGADKRGSKLERASASITQHSRHLPRRFTGPADGDAAPLPRR